jgi:porphobilinogen synthase
MEFPRYRARRTRRTETLRSMVRETELRVSDLVLPLFVTHGTGVAEAVPSMPGVERLSADRVPSVARAARDLGIPAVLLFGIPEEKDEIGSGAWDDDGPVPTAVRAVKEAVPDLAVFCDVCLCEYTSHGHCGPLRAMPGEKGCREVDNDASLPLLARAAVCYAEAGADVVAPSDMMDGRVAAIRQALDGASLDHVLVLSYAAKYASGFYGPFRDAAGSAPAFGDRRGYQMDPPNVREAIREILLDVAEGADLVMVKPALAYLDVIRAAREATSLPVVAYNVSGEYAMVKAAAERGWIDEDRVVLEILTGIKRAGADVIITYHAMHAATLLGGRR